METTLRKVGEILAAIPGAVQVAPLDDSRRRRVVELETRHEERLALPVRNLGTSDMAGRDACFVILKSGSFRPPGAPSVYMVEEGAPEKADHVLSLAGKRYAIIGEEVVDGIQGYSETVIPLEDSFVIFPERRSGPHVPCAFLIPPLPFPELERESAALGISEVISVSPSLVADAFLRESLGFSPSNDLATLLVGFNIAP